MKQSSKPHLSKQRKAEIASLAAEVFAEYFTVPPADPLQVFAALGITHSFGHYGDCFDGMLEYDGSEFHIYCNLDRGNVPNTPRARFTLAHELAHYFIDEHRIALMSGRIKPHPSKIEGSTTDLLAEQEADLFASFFLMPEELCSRMNARIGSGYEAITKLANLFAVSVHCAAIRYIENKAHPGALIFWNDQGYAWKRVSEVLWVMGCRKSIEDFSALVANCATSQLIENRTGRAKICESHSTLGAWFPHIPRQPVREIVVREQAIELGRFGILTVIEPIELKQTSAALQFSALSEAIANWSSN